MSEKKKSLRERLVALLLEDENNPEVKQPEVQPLAPVPDTPKFVALSEHGVEESPLGCPRCGHSPLQPAQPGVGRRCPQCGWQESVSGAKGFSRADYFSGKLPVTLMRRPREVQLRPRGFGQAIGRLLFGGR
jgi:hypothetical protein